MESEVSNEDIQVATLDVSREEFSVTPTHGEVFTSPSSIDTAESVHNPNATSSPDVMPNLSYHFSECDHVVHIMSTPTTNLL